MTTLSRNAAVTIAERVRADFPILRSGLKLWSAPDLFGSCGDQPEASGRA